MGPIDCRIKSQNFWDKISIYFSEVNCLRYLFCWQYNYIQYTVMTFPNYTLSPQLPVLLVSFFFPASSSHTGLYLFAFIYFLQSSCRQSHLDCVPDWNTMACPEGVFPIIQITQSFLAFFHVGLWSGWHRESIWGQSTPLYCWKLLLLLRLTVVLVYGYNHVCLDGHSTIYLFDLTSVIEMHITQRCIIGSIGPRTSLTIKFWEFLLC